MVIWMNNKSKMILLFLIMICLAISVVYVIKREDDKMSKIEDKVSKIEVGETYKATFFENVYDAEENFQEKGESYEYIKILDNKRFLFVSDNAHLPDRYYQADGDSKIITVEMGTYKIEGEDFVQDSYISSKILSFPSNIEVEKGASGKLSDGMDETMVDFKPSSSNLGIAIDKSQGYYCFSTVFLRKYEQEAPNLSDKSGWLYKSDVKLPDTVEEFLAQYKLTSDDNKKSSDIKSQSYERTPEGQEKKAKMFDLSNFPVHREDDGTIWVGF
jgi:hypothetical protein